MRSEGAPAAAARRSYRLHPLDIVVQLGRLVRAFLLPAILVLVTGAGQAWAAWALIGGGVAIVAAALTRHLTFRFGLEQGELFTQSGLLVRRSRHIPVGRIQDVRVEQSLGYRMLGIVKVEVEAAGGAAEAEVVLTALGRDEADAFRDALLAARAQAQTRSGEAPAPPAYAPPERLLRAIGDDELLLEGLTSGRLGVILAFFVIAVREVTRVVPGLEGRLEEALRGTIDWGEVAWGTAVLAVAGALALALAFGLVASVIASFVSFYRFQLSLRGEELMRRHGLFTDRASALPRRRIQTVLIEEGLLRRPLKLAGVRAVSAGSAGAAASWRSGRDLVLPIADRRELPALLPEVLPALGREPEPVWRRVSRKAIRRFFLKAMLGFAAPCAALGWLTGAWGAAGIALAALAPVALLLAWLRYRMLAYALGPELLRIRRGILARRVYVVPFEKLQSVRVVRTLLDRRLRLARLVVDTAGQPLLGRPQVLDLDEETAAALARDLGARAAQTRFRL